MGLQKQMNRGRHFQGWFSIVQFFHENGYLLVERPFTVQDARVFRQGAHVLMEILSQHADINHTRGSARQIAEGTKPYACLKPG